MKRAVGCVAGLFLVGWTAILVPAAVRAEVRAWEGELTIPTYGWEEDVNPKFWALEGGAKLSTTVHGAITYPYVMQDHLSRTKADRTYRALFLENEYLRVTCLPELGGRLHSVFDKTTNQEMFHTSRVIKPGMIAMRGAWISGGVEWNSGPHGHTVTIVSPVDAVTGRHADGSAYLEIANQEKIFRTRWTVRVTLHPGRAYLDEQIRIENPTDGMHPYYFWNCTAFPNRPGTRFIYPMSLGTDHNAREFFRWPVHEGRDLTWLKNYETYASVFAVNCSYDFFGAYDVDADRGIVQVANHHELGGKKAWTWGEWEFGKVAQKNLTDDDGPYIEVQSGPLPTQSDYGMLGPHERVAWQEYWYPVHGLGDGFEFANQNLAVQTARSDGRLELRLLATAKYDDAVCVLARDGQPMVRQQLNLSPGTPAVVALTEEPQRPVDVTVTDAAGRVLAAFTTPLPIPQVDPPDPAKFAERPDDALSVEELYLKGRKFDRATDRRQARASYELALTRDPGHVASLRALAVLDFEAGLYPRDRAMPKSVGPRQRRRLVLVLPGRQPPAARRFCGGPAVRLSVGTVSRHGLDRLRLGGPSGDAVGGHSGAIAAFGKAVRADGNDSTAADHLMLAQFAAEVARCERSGHRPRSAEPHGHRSHRPRLADDRGTPADLDRRLRSFLGEDEFELLEASLVFAELRSVPGSGTDRPGRLRRRRAAGRAELPAVLLLGLVRIAVRRRGWGPELADASGRNSPGTRVCVPPGRSRDPAVRRVAKSRRCPGAAAIGLPVGELGPGGRGVGGLAEGRQTESAAQHRLAESGPGGGCQGRSGHRRRILSKGHRCPARRPDAVPRFGGNPDRRRPAAGRDPAVGGHADHRHAAGRDHGHAGRSVRCREALRRLHPAAGSDAVLCQLGRPGRDVAAVQPFAHRARPPAAAAG